ncbi:MAG TPA: TetR/AcrR family transcriptional regulator, partial [Dehalococcoidia bacterium]|nr:TetR/AcrR family transcriptional regulator [Dehalococcoidia bacterium]
MTERRPRKPSQLRERIVEESLRLFANQGYSAVSIRDIAQAAKTTNPMIYYYFGSKDELYRHILQQQIESLKARLVQAAEIEGNPVERLGSFVDAYLSFYFKNDRATFTIRELFGLGSDLYRDTVSEIDAEMRRSLRRILRDGADEGLFREDGHDMAVIS